MSPADLRRTRRAGLGWLCSGLRCAVSAPAVWLLCRVVRAGATCVDCCAVGQRSLLRVASSDVAVGTACVSSSKHRSIYAPLPAARGGTSACCPPCDTSPSVPSRSLWDRPSSVGSIVWAGSSITTAVLLASTCRLPRRPRCAPRENLGLQASSRTSSSSSVSKPFGTASPQRQLSPGRLQMQRAISMSTDHTQPRVVSCRPTTPENTRFSLFRARFLATSWDLLVHIIRQIELCQRLYAAKMEVARDAGNELSPLLCCAARRGRIQGREGGRGAMELRPNPNVKSTLTGTNSYKRLALQVRKLNRCLAVDVAVALLGQIQLSPVNHILMSIQTLVRDRLERLTFNDPDASRGQLVSCCSDAEEGVAGNAPGAVFCAHSPLAKEDEG
eukprot:5084431-Pleurochrysis_carterae.AAC.3